MKTNHMLAATVALALAAPATLLAQGAGHEQHHGGAAQATPDSAPQDAPHGGMMGGGMMADGQMPPEMHERMRAHMQEVMRPMLREIIRDVMLEIETEGLDAPVGSVDDAGHDAHHADAAEDGSPATQAYRAANLAMHEAMDIDFTDDADIDFARGMIGHHQGAIDMARIVLEHGEDEELRQLAEEVIEAQEAEIEFLRDWLAERDS